MAAAYRDDLAYIHDVGFTDFATGAAPGLLGIFEAHRIFRGLVVDLGCGSGRWARALTDAGYRVEGIDISAAMIDIARRTAPKAKFRQGSFLGARLPACDAVTALGECFNYLFDQSNTRTKRVGLFASVYRALRPGGIFVFDVAEPGRGSGPPERHWRGPDWALLLEVDEDPRRSRLTRRMTTFRKVGRNYRRREEVHHLRLFGGPALALELRAVGFRVRILRGYGELRLARGQVALLARKP